MESYRVEVSPSAIRELEGIDQEVDRRRLGRRIRALGADPRPPGCQKIAGGDDSYRVRQGRFRVVYKINDADRIVTVFRIGDRRDVYR